MKNTFKLILFGFLLWLAVFVCAFFIFPVKQSNPAFFETLITLFLSGFTVLFGRIYFKNFEIVTAGNALFTGFAWMAVNIIIDVPLFILGPFKIPPVDYITDIGLTYIAIPVILLAFTGRRKV